MCPCALILTVQAIPGGRLSGNLNVTCKKAVPGTGPIFEGLFGSLAGRIIARTPALP